MKARLNAKKLLLACFNSLLSMSFFFRCRRVLLRVAGVSIGEDSTMHRGVRLFDFGNMSIGRHCTINPGCFLDNRVGIRIGDNVNVSHDVRIYTLGHDVNDPQCHAVGREVVIGDNAWIFPNVLVMPGVHIGAGAVVYPGSVVVRDVPEYSVVGGNPAKVLRERNREIGYRADFPVWLGI